ncbi:hypothetical protein CP532_3253, partial [Ophiocordyceps camponoti-leonardi (nom. inval.)]
PHASASPSKPSASSQPTLSQGLQIVPIDDQRTTKTTTAYPSSSRASAVTAFELSVGDGDGSGRDSVYGSTTGSVVDSVVRSSSLEAGLSVTGNLPSSQTSLSSMGVSTVVTSGISSSTSLSSPPGTPSSLSQESRLYPSLSSSASDGSRSQATPSATTIVSQRIGNNTSTKPTSVYTTKINTSLAEQSSSSSSSSSSSTPASILIIAPSLVSASNKAPTTPSVLTTAMTMVMPTSKPSETEAVFMGLASHSLSLSLVSFISRPSSLQIPSYPVPKMTSQEATTTMTMTKTKVSTSSTPSSSSSKDVLPIVSILSSPSYRQIPTTSPSPTPTPTPTPTTTTRTPTQSTQQQQQPQPYNQNIVLATHLNNLYSILTPSQRCLPNQEACIDGKIARCSNGSFELEACRQKEERCYAWPFSSTVGVYVACRTSLDALKVLGKEDAAVKKKVAVETTLKTRTRPVVTLTTVVTVTDESSSMTTTTTPSYPTPPTASIEESTTPSSQSSRAPTGKPGFIIPVTGPIAGPTPTITTPYLLSTPAPKPTLYPADDETPIKEDAAAPKAKKQPPALMVLPLDGYSSREKKKADVAPLQVQDEGSSHLTYSTVTVTETKVPDTVTVTVVTSKPSASL